MNDFIQGQMKLRRAEVMLVGVLCGFAAAVTLWGIYLAYVDVSPPWTNSMVYMTDTLEHPKDKFKAGDTVFVYRDLCFTKEAPVQWGRTLQSVDRTPPLNIVINSTNGMMKKGCVPGSNVIQIPDYTPPGMYRYSVIGQYSNNPLQSGVGQLPAPVIEVMP